MKTEPVTCIKFTKEAYQAIKNYLLRDDFESMCYAIGHRHGRTVCVTQVIKPPEGAYLRRSRVSAVLTGEFRNQVHYEYAQSEGTVLLNCHSHPFETGNAVHFSGIDDRDDHIELNHVNHQLCIGKREFSKPDTTLVLLAVQTRLNPAELNEERNRQDKEP